MRGYHCDQKNSPYECQRGGIGGQALETCMHSFIALTHIMRSGDDGDAARRCEVLSRPLCRSYIARRLLI